MTAQELIEAYDKSYNKGQLVSTTFQEDFFSATAEEQLEVLEYIQQQEGSHQLNLLLLLDPVRIHPEVIDDFGFSLKLEDKLTQHLSGPAGRTSAIFKHPALGCIVAGSSWSANGAHIRNYQSAGGHQLLGADQDAKPNNAESSQQKEVESSQVVRADL